MKKMRKLLNNKKGFTLIELLVVLAVLGILATIAVPRFTGMQGKAYEARAKAELKQVQTAMELYYAEYNSYPADQDGFTAAVGEYLTAGDLAAYSFTYTINGGVYSIAVTDGVADDDYPVPGLTITRTSIE